MKWDFDRDCFAYRKYRPTHFAFFTGWVFFHLHSFMTIYFQFHIQYMSQLIKYMFCRNSLSFVKIQRGLLVKMTIIWRQQTSADRLHKKCYICESRVLCAREGQFWYTLRKPVIKAIAGRARDGRRVIGLYVDVHLLRVWMRTAQRI